MALAVDLLPALWYAVSRLTAKLSSEEIYMAEVTISIDAFCATAERDSGFYRWVCVVSPNPEESTWYTRYGIRRAMQMWERE
jgi:hypothetical protein